MTDQTFFFIFSRHGDGGHYHYDTTPDEVEYVGYFNLAEGESYLATFLHVTNLKG